MVAYDDLTAVDQYILVKLNDVVKEVRKDCEEYDYVDTSKVLMNFMVNELSSYYCDFTKDILYCNALNDTRRRQVQTVYWKCLDALVKLWAPFLCYTTEEVWMHFNNDEAESVHYCHFPAVESYANADALKEEFASLLDVRTDVMKALEESRNAKTIGTAQEAEVQLTVCKEDADKLNEGLNGSLAQWLIVSKATVEVGAERSVKVVKATGTKCPRCWNYSTEADENGLCPRCQAVMKAEK